MIPIPPLATLKLIAAGVVVLVAFGVGWKARAVIADSAMAKVVAAHQQERITAQAAHIKAQAEARAEEARRVQKLGEIAHDAETRTANAQIDARRAGDAANRLREHIARLVASPGGATSDPATATASEATAGPGLVLAKLFQRVDDRAGELAAFADAAHTAGLACQRSYEALSQ